MAQALGFLVAMVAAGRELEHACKVPSTCRWQHCGSSRSSNCGSECYCRLSRQDVMQISQFLRFERSSCV